MAIRINRSDPWKTCNADKFDFDERARELDAQNQFAPVDAPPGMGLREFIDRQTRVQAASSGSSETLIPGKLYLRQQPSGMWELIHNRGRGTFDCYPGETREELVEFAQIHFLKES